MPFGPASLLGVERFSEESEAPLELIPGDDDARKEQIIRAVYKQVLGNAYVMDSERQIVTESQFKLGEISVRELVRRIAKSSLYRSRFFDTCARYRYIELAFRHLMGRAPADFAEMRLHSERLDAKGYDADIDSFLDCGEVEQAFHEVGIGGDGIDDLNHHFAELPDTEPVDVVEYFPAPHSVHELAPAATA